MYLEDYIPYFKVVHTFGTVKPQKKYSLDEINEFIKSKNFISGATVTLCIQDKVIVGFKFAWQKKNDFEMEKIIGLRNRWNDLFQIENTVDRTIPFEQGLTKEYLNNLLLPYRKKCF